MNSKNRKIVDELNALRVQRVALEKREAQLTAVLKGQGVGRYEGTNSDLLVVEQSRGTVDWQGLAKRVGFSQRQLASFSKNVVFLTLRPSAKGSATTEVAA